ncbi:MAG: hypothetical protein IJ195_06215 [Lachnospiraceae bacterium]|nr:hypothetical protein [Lachnospiraceae bacterium]
MNYIENLKNSEIVKEAAKTIGCPLSLAEIDPDHDKGINYWFLMYLRYIALKLEKEKLEASALDTGILKVVSETKYKNIEYLVKDVLNEFSPIEECGKEEYSICASHVKRSPIYHLYGAHKKIVSAFESAVKASA